MKAPDKIYIPIIEEDGKKLLCTNWWETDTSSRNAYVNKTIPYIRKGALIEWLENKINISDGGFVNGFIYLAYKYVIEHLKKCRYEHTRLYY